MTAGTDGKTVSGMRIDRIEQLIEMNDTKKEILYMIPPEKSAIEHNVKRALLLADKSVYHYYSDFAEKGYYNPSSPGTSTKC